MTARKKANVKVSNVRHFNWSQLSEGEQYFVRSEAYVKHPK